MGRRARFQRIGLWKRLQSPQMPRCARIATTSTTNMATPLEDALAKLHQVNAECNELAKTALPKVLTATRTIGLFVAAAEQRQVKRFRKDGASSGSISEGWRSIHSNAPQR